MSRDFRVKTIGTGPRSLASIAEALWNHVHFFRNFLRSKNPAGIRLCLDKELSYKVEKMEFFPLLFTKCESGHRCVSVLSPDSRELSIGIWFRTLAAMTEEGQGKNWTKFWKKIGFFYKEIFM